MGAPPVSEVGRILARDAPRAKNSAFFVRPDDVLHVAHCFLRLAFGALRHAFRLLFAAAGHLADLLARLAGHVLQVSFRLVSIHLRLLLRTKNVRNGPSMLRARSASRFGPALRPGEAAARRGSAEALLRE